MDTSAGATAARLSAQTKALACDGQGPYGEEAGPAMPVLRRGAEAVVGGSCRACAADCGCASRERWSDGRRCKLRATAVAVSFARRPSLQLFARQPSLQRSHDGSRFNARATVRLRDCVLALFPAARRPAPQQSGPYWCSACRSSCAAMRSASRCASLGTWPTHAQRRRFGCRSARRLWMRCDQQDSISPTGFATAGRLQVGAANRAPLT
jgi:hypothetical protein